MDDVILLSSQFDFPAWERLFSDFDQKLTLEIYKSFLGMKGVEIIRKFIPNVNDQDLLKLQDRKERYFIDLLKEKGAKMTMGLPDLLDELKHNFKLGIATSAPKIKVNAILKYLNLQDYFSIIITSDMVSKGKPNPELFLKAAEELETAPQDCLVIEDSPNGIAAAKNGGMRCIAITTTHQSDDLSQADLIIAGFRELKLSTINDLLN